MNEAAAAGAKERDPLADVERQGPISWALHSIRTRYSLATAVFLLLALAMFYIGGRIVLVHLVHDAERQVKEIGVDVSRLAYRRADAVRQAAADACAAADGGRRDPAKCVETGGFSLAAEFAADGKFAGGSLRGADGAARPVSAEELAPYAEALSRWISTSTSPEARKAATGIVRVGGVSHFVALVPARAGGALMLGIVYINDFLCRVLFPNFVHGNTTFFKHEASAICGGLFSEQIYRKISSPLLLSSPG